MIPSSCAPSRKGLDLPEALRLVEDSEGALDPLFGVMYMGEPRLSPSALMEVLKQHDI